MADKIDQEVKNCWPTPWLEAALYAGFATYEGEGEYEFLSDTIRGMLEEFAKRVQLDEREACKILADNKSAHCDANDNYYGANAASDISDAIEQRPGSIRMQINNPFKGKVVGICSFNDQLIVACENGVFIKGNDDIFRKMEFL